MGKICRARQKFHSSAPKVGNATQEPTSNQECLNNLNYSVNFENVKWNINSSVNSAKSESNLFKDVVIQENFLKQKLPDSLDKQSVISQRSQEPISKAEKRRIKHEAFLKKLEAAKFAKKKMEEDLKRKNTPVVGDMRVLYEALPNVENTNKDEKIKKIFEKARASKSLKAQEKEMLRDIERYHQVLKNSTFASDPVNTISTHIKLFLQSEKK